jgi:hypothetical protein
MKTFTHPDWPNIQPVLTDDPERIAILERKGFIGVDYVEPIAVPEPITKVETWALREACMIAGYTAQIEAAIAALPNPQKAVAMNRWEHKPEIRRGDPLIAALIQILGWTTEQADALFTSANAIQNS